MGASARPTTPPQPGASEVESVGGSTGLRLRALSGSPSDTTRLRWLDYTDLTDDVTETARRLWWHGLDVIVVDQTTPEHRAGGFCCVKVIIPGALPMTFGHYNRRTQGLPRLLEVPRLLGYRDKALLPQDINPHPHPFP